MMSLLFLIALFFVALMALIYAYMTGVL